MRRRRAQKVSASALRRFVMREAAKLSGELDDVDDVKAKEVDADGYADSLEKDIDQYKAAEIKEAKLRRQHRANIKRIKKLREARLRAKRRILRRLK